MKPLQEYLDEVYPIEVNENASGAYTAIVPKIPGCEAQGATAEEAKANVRDKCAGMLKDFLAKQ